MKNKILLILLFTLGIGHADQSCEERIEKLEERVSQLEQILAQMEDLWVERYGLIRRCTRPRVQNGIAHCEQSSKIKPGTVCSVVCNAGYIATPGKTYTTCQEDGHWSAQLLCEEPLVVVGGGKNSEHGHTNSVEVIDFTTTQTPCNITMPDLPLVDGVPRSFHNLIFFPKGNKPKLLVCNGLTEKSVSVCDSLTIGENAWKPRTSFPNKGNAMEETLDDMHERRQHNSMFEPTNPQRKLGRYSAEAVTLDNRPIILGGMVYDEKNGHKATTTVRILSWKGDEWDPANALSDCWGGDLSIERAFFCSVKVQERGILNIGGYSDNGVISNVTMRSCSSKKYLDGVSSRTFQNTPYSISGHGCTMMPGSYDVLIAGGSRTQMDSARPNSYLYSWSNNTWAETGRIQRPRFGGEMVTVGTEVLMLGGKERNPDIYLDSIEQFDTKTRTWNIIDRKMQHPRAHFGLALIPRSLFPECKE